MHLLRECYDNESEVKKSIIERDAKTSVNHCGCCRLEKEGNLIPELIKEKMRGLNAKKKKKII